MVRRMDNRRLNRMLYSINESLKAIICEDKDKAKALYDAISQFEDEILATDDPDNPEFYVDQAGILKDLTPMKKAVEAFEQGLIYIDKVLDVAAKLERSLDQDWGVFGLYDLILNASNRASVPYLDNRIKLYDYADKKWAIVIPGYDVRDTIYTVLDIEPTEEDIDMFIRHILYLHYDIEKADLWQLDDSLPELPPTIDKDEWGRFIVQKYREDGGSLRDIQASWLMHPRILRQDALITSAYVLTDDIDNAAYIWDTSRDVAASYADELKLINKVKPSLVVGTREQYLEFFELASKLNYNGRLITGGQGDPWYIKWSDVDSI